MTKHVAHSFALVNDNKSMTYYCLWYRF